MNSDFFFNAVKGQFNSLNLIIAMCLTTYLLYRKHKRTAALATGITTLVFFLMVSTAYVPGYFVHRMESTYPPFEVSNFALTDKKVFIHVLGGGYTADERLSGVSQLSMTSLGRLAEALRIAGKIPDSKLVVSGNIASGKVSMAAVAKNASIGLGFDSTRVIMLSSPATTLEEARAFADLSDDTDIVIVVTDAIHMPRAMRFFKDCGLDAYAAPTNYLIKFDDNPFALRWMPSAENFLLMDRVIREWLGSLKASLSAAR